VADTGPRLPDEQGALADLILGDPAVSFVDPLEVRLAGSADRLREAVKKFSRNESGPVPSLGRPKAYISLAAIAVGLDLNEEAVLLADRAVALDQSGVSGRLLKAKALIATGNHKKAIGVLDEALKREPRLAAAHLMKARSLLSRGMYERAVESYREAFAAEASPEALVEAGGCWLALGDPEKAERLFGEARERFPGASERVRAGVGRVAAEARKQRAQLVLKGLLRTFGDDAGIWAETGRCYVEMKEPERAVRCFEKAKALGATSAIETELAAAMAGARQRLRCPACEGSGACRGCKSGKCDRCQGSGECPACDGGGACPTCKATEDCPRCGGRGRSGLVKRCDACEGSGGCPECEEGECSSCGRSGECPGCGGKGVCVECGGSASCRICKGSGVPKTAG
jgi:tetratricopeptide (TPR) repeat protein